jgi:glucose/arabinose dehydrogenase
MADVNLIAGNDGSNSLQGGSGPDLIYGWNPNGPQGTLSTISATRVASGLSQPLFVTSSPDNPNRLFIVEKGGLIKVLDLTTGAVDTQPFLDVSTDIVTAGEQGLLGLAFHPEYAQNGRFYVYLSNVNGDSEVRQYRVSATDPTLADPASRKAVLTVDQPTFTNHKAGWIEFGPDGYLYIALGDGGGGDPSNNAQNTDSLLGKILRIDVNADDFLAESGRNYAVPDDNPFVNTLGAAEVWAYGLRNPFRNSFDRGLGDLYIADVGESTWEEINLGAPGANYGWKRYEGTVVHDPNAPLNGVHTPPIHVYAHDNAGGRSVTGGYVYRGQSEGLHGQYFFGDFVSNRIWTLANETGTWVATERTGQIVTDVGTLDRITSFGEDGLGNLYVVSFDGEVFRLTPQVISADAADTLRGGAGDDMIFAGSGNDRLFGNAGTDSLNGMNGKDVLDGGAGNDSMVGGTGVDTASYAFAPAGVQVSLAVTAAQNTFGGGVDTISQIENLEGSPFNDTLTGNGLSNRLNGFGGADLMRGLGGNDIYVVQNATDVVNESVTGSGGTDTVQSTITFSLSDTGHAKGSLENLTLLGGSAINATGNSLANTLTGNTGTNTLNGGAGNDALKGGLGNDLLIGGPGQDDMIGGSGFDRFDFNSISESLPGLFSRDVITDFVGNGAAAGDRIDVSTIDANVLLAGNQAFTFRGGAAFTAAGQLRYSGGVLQGSTDADASAEFAIQLAGAPALVAADIVL